MNRLYFGDNLKWLSDRKEFPDASVDVVYLDPPFNSERNYEVFCGETKENRSFEDRHESIKADVDYMCPQYGMVNRPEASVVASPSAEGSARVASNNVT
jgi:16S rRNA G966 N2-methylase RsmD